MNISEQIIELARKNNGVITSRIITENNISRGNLKYLVDSGKLEKSARGVYVLPDVFDDDFYNLQSRFKKGIFSGETALFLWNLTDRTPNIYEMTFPSNYNLSNVKKENVDCNRVKDEWYSIGQIAVKSPYGNDIVTYSMERTLCDILRRRKKTDIGIITDAFREYVQRDDRNIPLLSDYSELFHVKETVRKYLEVLL